MEKLLFSKITLAALPAHLFQLITNLAFTKPLIFISFGYLPNQMLTKQMLSDKLFLSIWTEWSGTLKNLQQWCTIQSYLSMSQLAGTKQPLFKPFHYSLGFILKHLINIFQIVFFMSILISANWSKEWLHNFFVNLDLVAIVGLTICHIGTHCHYQKYHHRWR